MNKIVDKIHESEILAKLEWLSVIAESEFRAMHGSKTDGPRSATEQAFIDIHGACEAATFAIKEALEKLEPKP